MPNILLCIQQVLKMAKIFAQEEQFCPIRSSFSPLTLCPWYLGSGFTFCHIDPMFSPSESISSTELARVQSPKVFPGLWPPFFAGSSDHLDPTQGPAVLAAYSPVPSAPCNLTIHSVLGLFDTSVPFCLHSHLYSSAPEYIGLYST